MNAFDKIKQLSEPAKYDISCACSNVERSRSPEDPVHKWIYPATLPDGSTAPILKILQNNFCVNNCGYCVNSAGAPNRPVSFEPEELSKAFMEMHAGGAVRGLFLSSALGLDSRITMEQMIKTADILRNKYLFKGYIHLKVLPGASFAHVEKAVSLATRISVNLEAPSQERLLQIAPCKDFGELMTLMKWIDALGAQSAAQKSQTTQFVIGAADETDRETVKAVSGLYKKINLARAYFSAFQPVTGTPLENHPPVPLMREHRLYQVDFLMRKYGYKYADIIFDKTGNLPLEVDPKTLWAKKNKKIFPLEVNRAELQELLRVPGIGPLGARKIINARRSGKISGAGDLRAMGISLGRCAEYLLINGRRPQAEQMYFNFKAAVNE